jgi:hypothetical protein
MQAIGPGNSGPVAFRRAGGLLFKMPAASTSVRPLDLVSTYEKLA